jgi:hypothetical protein
MSETVAKLHIRIAFWVFWYAKAVIWFAILTDNEPDWIKLSATIRKGITVS